MAGVCQLAKKFRLNFAQQRGGENRLFCYDRVNDIRFSAGRRAVFREFCERLGVAAA